ncbi:wall-associated kinase family protein [Tanacetum coccineum]
MRLFQAYQVILVIFVHPLTTSIAYSNYAKTGCNDTCGNVRIPYPFGIGVNCSVNEWYVVECNSSTPYLSALNHSLEVLGVDLENQTIAVNTQKFSKHSETKKVDLGKSPFLLLESYNKASMMDDPILLLWTLSDRDKDQVSCCDNYNPRGYRRKVDIGNGTSVDSWKCAYYEFYEGTPYLTDGCEDYPTVTEECARCEDSDGYCHYDTIYDVDGLVYSQNFTCGYNGDNNIDESRSRKISMGFHSGPPKSEGLLCTWNIFRASKFMYLNTAKHVDAISTQRCSLLVRNNINAKNTSKGQGLEMISFEVVPPPNKCNQNADHRNLKSRKVSPLLLPKYWIIMHGVDSWSTATSIAVTNYAKPGCNDMCGKVRIPYPFGIGANCSVNKWYNIDCNSSTPYLSALNHLEVLGVDLQNQTISVNMQKVSACSQTTKSVDLVNSPFLYSKSQNKFVVEGCGNGVFMGDDSNVLTGCSTTCSNHTTTSTAVTVNTNNTCVGIDCCQTTIPHYLNSYSIILTGLEGLDGDRACGSAFLVDKNSYDKGRFSGKSFIPTSLLWTLVDYKQLSCCEGHMEDRRTVDLSNGTSVDTLKCWSNYDPLNGNPYLLDGCYGM